MTTHPNTCPLGGPDGGLCFEKRKALVPNDSTTTPGELCNTCRTKHIDVLENRAWTLERRSNDPKAGTIASNAITKLAVDRELEAQLKDKHLCISQSNRFFFRLIGQSVLDELEKKAAVACKLQKQKDKLCNSCTEIAKRTLGKALFSIHFHENGKVKFKCFSQDADFADVKLGKVNEDWKWFRDVIRGGGQREKCQPVSEKGEFCKKCAADLREHNLLYASWGSEWFDGREDGKNLVHRFLPAA